MPRAKETVAAVPTTRATRLKNKNPGPVEGAPAAVEGVSTQSRVLATGLPPPGQSYEGVSTSDFILPAPLISLSPSE